MHCNGQVPHRRLSPVGLPTARSGGYSADSTPTLLTKRLRRRTYDTGTLGAARERVSTILTVRQTRVLQVYWKGQPVAVVAVWLGLCSRQLRCDVDSRSAVEAVIRELLPPAPAEFFVISL